MLFQESLAPLKGQDLKKCEAPKEVEKTEEPPTLKDFPATFLRIVTNKLLMANVLGGCFYVISAAAFMNFLSKYLEVQFGTSPGGGTVITGKIFKVAT